MAVRQAETYSFAVVKENAVANWHVPLDEKGTMSF